MKKILLINNNSKHIEDLATFLKVDGEVDLVSSSELENLDYEKVNTSYDLVVLSGGSNIRSVYSHPEDYKIEVEFIKKLTIPLVGICLGCEIISVAFSGELRDLFKKVEGFRKISIKGTDDSFVAFEAHHYGISKIPVDFEVLAESVVGPEIIYSKIHKVIGFQFHPEMTEDFRLIFEYLLNKINK
jgi:GMP synthase-like glutamine amidotransferase